MAAPSPDARSQSQPAPASAHSAGHRPTPTLTLPLPLQTAGCEALRSPTNQLLSPALYPPPSPYASPLRHHRRTASAHREVKETLNARSEYTNSTDTGSQHHINQYIIGEEIGRGSFGAVHLAVDQYGQEYAVKEFSKSRLRKRAKSHILRRPPPTRRSDPESGLEALHARSASDIHKHQENGNPLYLIREEIAIMKKLNHPNLVSLIEVLDDPDEDSLYMVLEICKKGVVMKVGLDETTDPYDPEQCRCWFRDLILGIEYLHAQGIVHRDIKPDNLLVTEEDVLKVVDFGVSEMFEKDTEMLTKKSAGSPAFLPPELCIAKHGDISGRAADIWSMGVSLYCLRFGQLPFERTSVLELYESIKNDEIDLKDNTDPNFADLMHRILEKDPQKRITMDELRNHPWVTQNGTDFLLSAEENTANLVEPPTETEMNHAITSNIKNLMTVMSAVNKFKRLLLKRHPSLKGAEWAQDIRLTDSPTCASPASIGTPVRTNTGSISIEAAVLNEEPAPGIDLASLQTALPSYSPGDPDSTPKATLVRHDNDTGLVQSPTSNEPESAHSAHTQHGQHGSRGSSGERGHAHLLSEDEPLFLGVGSGGEDIDSSAPPEDVIAESPTAADFNIYDTAYRDEVRRIRQESGQDVTIYLTRRLENDRSPGESAASRWKSVMERRT